MLKCTFNSLSNADVQHFEYCKITIFYSHTHSSSSACGCRSLSNALSIYYSERIRLQANICFTFRLSIRCLKYEYSTGRINFTLNLRSHILTCYWNAYAQAHPDNIEEEVKILLFPSSLRLGSVSFPSVHISRTD